MVFEHTKDAGPDETFFVTGKGLSGEAIVWCVSPDSIGGQFFKVKPQYATGDQAAITIPEKAQDGPVIVWFNNEKGWSLPIRLNVPQAWWCSPDRVHPGDDIRIFGRDLARRPDRSRAFAYMARPGKDGQWLQVKNAEKYSLTVSIPKDIAVGDYKIWLYAGAGGDLGWSDPVSIRIDNRFPISSSSAESLPWVLTVNKSPDEDLQSLIDKTAAKGGGTVLLSEGTHYFRGTLRIPGNVTLTGQGKDATLLQLINDPDAEYPEFEFPLPKWGAAAVMLTGSSAGISNLTISGNSMVNVGIAVRPEKELEWIEGCLITGVRVADIEGKRAENCGIRLARVTYATVSDNEFWGRAPVFLSGARQSSFVNNKLVSVSRYGGNSEGAILSRCEPLEECVIEDNRFACPPGAEAGGPTARRMIWLSTGRGSVSHNWIAGNSPEQTAGTGQAGFAGVAGTDQNVGEMILFEANHRNMYFGQLAGADEQTVLLPKTLLPTPDAYFGSMSNGKTTSITRNLLSYDDKGNETPFWPPDNDDGGVEPPIGEYYVSILSGPGQGQTRRVVKRKEERLFLSRPWTVAPTSESTVAVGTAFYQNIIKENHASDGMTGVQLWMSCVENVIAGNAIARQRKQGIYLYSTASTMASSMPRTWNRGISPLFFNYVEGNTTEECLAGVQVNAGIQKSIPSIPFSLALGNVVRHNSFIKNRTDGVNVDGGKTEALNDPSATKGTIVEFNIVRDAVTGYRFGKGADNSIARRNHAYFWYPVNNSQEPPVGFAIDNTGKIVVVELNNSEVK